MDIKKIFKIDLFKLIILAGWTIVDILFGLTACPIGGLGPQPPITQCILWNLQSGSTYIIYFIILITLYFATCLISWIYYLIKK